mmetsp:Transcript_29533/g.26115  ORF Transcript_29533/g.26115 Transcript_29533/m.26115 type:complete len:401 (-) Transcript_29533:59-1261(-)
MNEYLSKFLLAAKEHKQKTQSALSYKYGSRGQLHKTKEEKLKNHSYESANYSKLIKNLKEEHENLKQRVFIVQDHKYIINLKREVKDTKKLIKEFTTQNTKLKNTQFGKDRKLNQVIKRGKNDAINEVSGFLKDLVVFEERNQKYDNQIEFQNKTEIEIDEETVNAKIRVEEIEQQCKDEGILDKDPQQEMNSFIYSPEKINIMKKKIEKHSLDAIHRKFYTKILKQKERLNQDLSSHHDSLTFHNTTLNSEDIPRKNLSVSFESKLKLKKHPLMKEINKTLTDLKKSLPTITSKLTWEKPLFYRRSKYNLLDKNIKNRSRLKNQATNGARSEETRKLQNPKNEENEYSDVKRSHQTNIKRKDINKSRDNFQTNTTRDRSERTISSNSKTLLKSHENNKS